MFSFLQQTFPRYFKSKHGVWYCLVSDSERIEIVEHGPHYNRMYTRHTRYGYSDGIEQECKHGKTWMECSEKEFNLMAMLESKVNSTDKKQLAA